MSYKSVNALSIAVGKRLKSILDARHMPYGKLADAIDMPKSYLSEIMNGKRRCNSDHIEQFAAALGISPAELMEGEGEDEIRKAMRDVGSLCKEHQDDVLKYIAMKKKLQEIDKDKP